MDDLRALPEVMAVYLIGSYHRGDFGPFSDVDLVVVVDESEDRFLDRPLKYRPVGFPVPLDVFVYTEAEVHQMKESSHPFWRHIEQDHTVLLQKRDSTPVAKK